ncbi:MAG: diacylglycerol kinase family protein [Phycisphaerae bacterium]|jgi:YegS/Rv2252/BmrU family lipid kinase
MIKPDDGYVALIVNPKSGATHSGSQVRLLERYFAARGFEVRKNLTKSLEDARELATEAAVDYNCAVVAAAGGDGTIREVAHGLEGSDKPLLIVPQGTENLLANELGYDHRLETVVKIFEAGYTKMMDLGKANEKCFTCIVGFGFDGQVVEKVHHARDGHITHMDYFWPIWRSFWEYKFESFKVVADGEEIFNDRGLVFVGNISRYALGLNILHKADYSDGLLDVCVCKCDTRLKLLKLSLLTVFKQHWKSKDVISLQAKKISVSTDCENVLTEIDGDPGPSMPVDIEIIPQAVKIFVPENAKPAGFRTRIMRALK